MAKSKLNSLSYLQTNKSQLKSCRSLNQPPKATHQRDAHTNGRLPSRADELNGGRWWTGLGIASLRTQALFPAVASLRQPEVSLCSQARDYKSVSWNQRYNILRAFKICLVLVLIQERMPQRGTSRLLELAFNPDRHFEYREDPWDEVSSDTKWKIVGMRKEVEIGLITVFDAILTDRQTGLK